MFVSTDVKRPYPRGVIGSTVGAYPRGTSSNHVEGNGHFFPSYRQLYLSSFFDTHTHTHTSSIGMADVYYAKIPYTTQPRNFLRQLFSYNDDCAIIVY